MITVETADHVMTITIDRPEKLNALTYPMLYGLVAAFDRADEDDDVRAIVVTGRGRAFCAGADLSGDNPFTGEPQDAPADGMFSPARDGGGVLALRIFASLKPVIGAINGAAVGGGASLTLPMDIRLASTTARYGFVFTRRGIVPDGCASWFLPRLVGIATAQEWVLTGRMIDAEECRARGLVRSVHEPDDLLPAAYAIAAEIVDNAAPVSVSLSRLMLWRMLGIDHPMTAHEVETLAILWRSQTEDAIEGVRSFMDKRRPFFTGRVSSDLPDSYPWWSEPEFGRSLH